MFAQRVCHQGSETSTVLGQRHQQPTLSVVALKPSACPSPRTGSGSQASGQSRPPTASQAQFLGMCASTWQHLKRGTMTRPHLAKMAQVKREDARDIQSFRHSDDRCINEAQAIVCVCAYELGRAPRVCNGQSLPVKVTLDEGVQEARLRTGAQVSFQEIPPQEARSPEQASGRCFRARSGGPSRDAHRRDQPGRKAGGCQPEAPLADQPVSGSISAVKMSSIRSEISLRPESPIPTNEGSRRRGR